MKGQNPLSSLHGLDISLLPPCQQALKKHIMRANYQAMIWRQAYIAHPDIPHPSCHGWTMSANGVLCIDWCKDLVPQQLVDILHDYERTDEYNTEIDNDTTDNDSTDMNTTEEDDVEIDFFKRIRL